MYDVIGDIHGHADELEQLLGGSVITGTLRRTSIPNAR